MNPRSLLAFAHDLVVCALAWIGGFMLRFNFDVQEPWWSMMWRSLAWVLPLQALVFWRLRLYQGLWRYASVPDLWRIVFAAGLGTVVLVTGALLFDVRDLPRSVILVYPLLLASFMGATRFAYRVWKEGRMLTPKQLGARRLVILGAGGSGTALARNLRGAADLVIVGFLDDDPKKIGHSIHGLPVLGRIEQLPELKAVHEIEQAVIAMPGRSHQTRRRAFELAAAAQIPAYAVPGAEDLAAGRVQVSQLHKVELEDLLGRDPVTLDTDGLNAFLRGRCVLVTGAGGSIGSELCRQIAPYSPRLLVLLESNEFALYRIGEEFARRFPDVPIASVIGDVKDALRVAEVFKRHAPDVVFHAAAYKHVPLMESANAWEAARNNILGTYRVARAAVDNRAGAFVLVSTDKAVNPTNVMGATKRVAEIVCQALQRPASAAQSTRTKFVTVRFGNVLGSTGSVVPKFREQIAAGGPITVTHPEVTRYFMLIPEATQLVLQAGMMGAGGEIFVLDMGEPIRIADLARDLIRLSGLRESDIRIEFVGLRPGEKLFEEVLADDESTLPTPHAKLRIARASPGNADGNLAELLAWLEEPAVRDDDAVRAMLKRWVPEYAPAAVDAG